MSILDQLFARGRAELPTIEVDETAWRRCGEQWLGLARAQDRTEVPDSRSVEVFVVLAATAGSETASQWLAERYFDGVRDALRGAGVPDADRDDAVQQVWTRMFATRDDEPAAALRYVGHGDLAGLLKVSAARIALNRVRDRGRLVPEESAAAIADELDVELATIERRYRSEFKAAFEAAVAQLSTEDRNLLRMHILDGLSIDRLAALQGIHRSTAARRVAKAREQVAAGVREELVARIGDQGPVQSLLRVVRSGLDLSLSRVLGD